SEREGCCGCRARRTPDRVLRGRGDEREGTAEPHRGDAAGAHGSVAVRAARSAAADAERKARPQGAAGARDGGTVGRGRSADWRGGEGAGGDLGGGAEARAGREERELL